MVQLTYFRLFCENPNESLPKEAKRQSVYLNTPKAKKSRNSFPSLHSFQLDSHPRDSHPWNSSSILLFSRGHVFAAPLPAPALCVCMCARALNLNLNLNLNLSPAPSRALRARVPSGPVCSVVVWPVSGAAPDALRGAQRHGIPDELGEHDGHGCRAGGQIHPG